MRKPFLRRVKGGAVPDLPKSRESTAGPVRRFDPREPWPADVLPQVARRNGMERREMFSLLEAQGHRCALCGGEFKPWGLSPRLADESRELVCVGCRARLRLASGVYWQREAA